MKRIQVSEEIYNYLLEYKTNIKEYRQNYRNDWIEVSAEELDEECGPATFNEAIKQIIEGRDNAFDRINYLESDIDYILARHCQECCNCEECREDRMPDWDDGD